MPLDLLHPEPRLRIDVEHTQLALSLAFASGVSGGLFVDALRQASVAPSTWEPESFAADLYLSTFVSQCWRVVLSGDDRQVTTAYVQRVLERPPSDLRVTEHRRAILAELVESPALRASLESLYNALARFRALLEGATGVGKWDPARRQLDLLQQIKDIVDHLDTGFASARSGLRQLHEEGARIRAAEPFRSLADLLAYDEQLATLKLHVRVGADGRIRGFEVLGVQENQDNPFVMPPWRRWLAKGELFLRGFKFGDGEVMARLIDAVFEGIAPELPPLVQLFGDCEVLLGALGFRDLARAQGLEVCLPELVAPESPRALHALFNPLLLAASRPPVPCELASDRFDTTLLVTGPNSGGKTRLLQSVGLVQLLAQSGMFVPAREARIAPVPSLVMSLLQQQSADQSEGRLGMELVRIRGLFERLPPGAMVVLDELCSGTNPSEGEEIFELVVRTLTQLHPQAFITTHFLQFAARLERDKPIADLRFLQVELGPREEPTYQFVPGVAETSLAGQAAARLGVTADELASLVERNIARAKTSLRPTGR